MVHAHRAEIQIHQAQGMRAVDRDQQTAPVRQIRQFLHRCDEPGHVGDVTHHDHLGPRRDGLLEQADDLIDALRRRRDLDGDDLDANPFSRVL